MEKTIAAFLILAATVFSGCGMNSADCHEVFCSPDRGGDHPAPKIVSLEPLESTVFVAKCNPCHQSQCTSVITPDLWLDTETATMTTAVNVPAVGTVDGQPMLRIKPGDRYQSFLYLKMIGAPGLSEPSVPDEAGITLTEEEIEAVGAWIDAGATE